jgi:hypothetical protein
MKRLYKTIRVSKQKRANRNTDRPARDDVQGGIPIKERENKK